MSCPYQPPEPRVPCTECPSAESVQFLPVGIVPPLSREIFNENFEVLQCLADMCLTSQEDGGPYTVSVVDGVITVTDITSGESFSITVTVGETADDGTFDVTFPDGTVKNLQCGIKYHELLPSDPAPAGNGTLQIVTDPNTNEILYMVLPDGSVKTLAETTTTLERTNPLELTYTDEDGVAHVIDLCPDVQECETTTSISYNGATGELSYIDEDGATTVMNLPLENFLNSASYEPTTNVLTLTLVDGTVFDVDLTDLVDIETITTLVDNNNNSFTYTSEDGTVTTWSEAITTLSNNGDGSFTYTSEDGTAVTIDVNNSSVTQVVTGQEIATHDDGNGNVVSIQESVTTLADNGDGTFTYTSEDGTQTQIDVTNSSVVNNGDGTWTHDNGDGTQVTIDVCAMIADGGCTDSLVDNGDGSFTHTALDGTAVTISVNNLEVIPVVSGQVIATIDDGNGNLTDIEESVTTLADNGDGTFTYTSEDGTQTQIDVTNSSITNNNDGTFTHDNGDGTQTTLDICQMIDDGGCSDVMTDEGNGVIAHVAVDGTVFQFQINNSTVTQVVTGQEIASHDDGNGNVVSIQESVTTLADNGDGTFTYTSEDGTETIVDVSNSSVVNNGDGTWTHDNGDGTQVTIDVCAMIADGGCTDSLVDNGDGSFTHTALDGTAVTIPAPTFSVLTDNGDGTVEHQSGDGVTTVLDMCQIVSQGGCTPSVVTGPGQFEYTFDDGYGNTTVINVNELDADINDIDITGSIVTFTSEDGSIVTMDICQIVANNCNSSLTPNGNGTFTHVANNGTVTVIGPFITGVEDQGDGTIDVTDTNGITTNIDICQMIAANCSDTLVNNGDGSFTHTGVDGTSVTISVNNMEVIPIVSGQVIATIDDGNGNLTDIEESVTTLADNGDGTFTYTSEDGTQTQIDVTNSSVVNNGDGTWTHDNGDGTQVTIDVCAMIADGGCTDTLADNGDGSFTHTALDGTAVTIQVNNSAVTQVVTGQEIASHDDGNGNVVSIQESVTTLADNGDGTFTYTSEDGTETIVDVSNSSVVNNGDGTWTHDNGDGTQVTIDVCAMIADGGCTDTLVDNNDGSFTHTALDGTAVTIVSSKSVVSQTVTGQEIASHDDGTGTVVSIQESVTTLADNGDGTFTYTSEDGTETIVDVSNSSVVNNGDGTWTHDNGDGTQVTIDVCAMIADGGCTDTLVDNNDGSFTHTALDGTAVTIVSSKSVVSQTVTGQEIASHDDGTGTVVSIQESVTTLADNGDGTFTYTSEDGTETIVDISNSSVVNNGDGTWTHDNGDGTQVTIDVCAMIADGGCTDTLVNNGNGSFTHTALDGTAVTISVNNLEVIPGSFETPDVRVISTIDDGNGNLTNIEESVTTLVDTGCTFDYTSEDGTVVSVDYGAKVASDQCNIISVVNDCELVAYAPREVCNYIEACIPVSPVVPDPTSLALLTAPYRSGDKIVEEFLGGEWVWTRDCTTNPASWQKTLKVRKASKKWCVIPEQIVSNSPNNPWPVSPDRVLYDTATNELVYFIETSPGVYAISDEISGTRIDPDTDPAVITQLGVTLESLQLVCLNTGDVYDVNDAPVQPGDVMTATFKDGLITWGLSNTCGFWCQMESVKFVIPAIGLDTVTCCDQTVHIGTLKGDAALHYVHVRLSDSLGTVLETQSAQWPGPSSYTFTTPFEDGYLIEGIISDSDPIGAVLASSTVFRIEKFTLASDPSGTGALENLPCNPDGTIDWSNAPYTTSGDAGQPFVPIFDQADWDAYLANSDKAWADFCGQAESAPGAGDQECIFCGAVPVYFQPCPDQVELIEVTPFVFAITEPAGFCGETISGCDDDDGLISSDPIGPVGVFEQYIQLDGQNPDSFGGDKLWIPVGGGGAPLSITDAAFPVLTVGDPISGHIDPVASGGTTPYTYSIESGALPAGIALSPITGALSGTPSTPSSGTVIIRVTDSVLAVASTSLLSWDVDGPLSIADPVFPAMTVGVVLSGQTDPVASGGETPYTYTVQAGALPLGVTMDPSTGVLSGTPTTVETGSVVIRATDSDGREANSSLVGFTVVASPAMSVNLFQNAINGCPSIFFDAASVNTNDLLVVTVASAGSAPTDAGSDPGWNIIQGNVGGVFHTVAWKIATGGDSSSGTNTLFTCSGSNHYQAYIVTKGGGGFTGLDGTQSVAPNTNAAPSVTTTDPESIVFNMVGNNEGTPTGYGTFDNGVSTDHTASIAGFFPALSSIHGYKWVASGPSGISTGSGGVSPDQFALSIAFK